MEVTIRKATSGGFIILTAKVIDTDQGKQVVKQEILKQTEKEVVEFVEKFIK